MIGIAMSHFFSYRLTHASLFFSLLLITGCDRLGFPDPGVEVAAQAANAKATGSACRHAGRAIEDCYSLNPKSSRASVYEGWKEMNDYMRENNIAEVIPSHNASEASASASSEEHGESASAEGSASASAESASASEH